MNRRNIIRNVEPPEVVDIVEEPKKELNEAHVFDTESKPEVKEVQHTNTIDCECGKTVSKKGYKRHQQTKGHLNAIDKQVADPQTVEPVTKDYSQEITELRKQLSQTQAIDYDRIINGVHKCFSNIDTSRDTIRKQEQERTDKLYQDRIKQYEAQQNRIQPPQYKPNSVFARTASIQSRYGKGKFNY